jgi:transposase
MAAERQEHGAEAVDVAVGLDLGSQRHAVVVLGSDGRRLTSFEIPHALKGFEELVRRCEPARLGRPGGRVVFAFEATGHFWEALAHFLTEHGYPYALVNPLATFRVREARQMGRDKRDVTDAEQVADLLRTGLVTRGSLHAPRYVTLRRAWGESVRLRDERARLKTLVKHQLYGAFPELVTVWTDIFTPGLLAVLRTGLTPLEISALSFPAFWERVQAVRKERRLWQFKVRQVHERAAQTVAAPHGMAAIMRELRRIVDRVDTLGQQITVLSTEIHAVLAEIDEAGYLATLPGIGWVSVAGLIAHIGPIDRFRHGRQLVKLAGLNPARHESGTLVGRTPMTHRGRAGLRAVVYMATVSCIQHNPRLKAHYERLVQRPVRPLPKMQALGACMTKLLLYTFAVMKRRETFDTDHQWGASVRTAA